MLQEPTPTESTFPRGSQKDQTNKIRKRSLKCQHESKFLLDIFASSISVALKFCRENQTATEHAVVFLSSFFIEGKLNRSEIAVGRKRIKDQQDFNCYYFLSASHELNYFTFSACFTAGGDVLLADFFASDFLGIGESCVFRDD